MQWRLIAVCVWLHAVLVWALLRALTPDIVKALPWAGGDADEEALDSVPTVIVEPEKVIVEPEKVIVEPERFLYACIITGRHHNQLITLSKAWSLAARTGRTLVVPPFVQAPDGPREPSFISRRSLRSINYSAVYDWDALAAGPVKVVHSEAFFKTMEPEVKASVSCLYYTGCLGAPKIFEYTCHPIRNINPTARGPRLLLIGMKLYNIAPRPALAPPCLWHFLRPVPAILEEVRWTKKKLPAQYLGVHQRSFGHSPPCQIVLKWFWGKYHGKVPAENRTQDPPIAMKECEMPPRYVSKFLPEPGTPFYLGTDNYEPRYTAALMKIKAVQYDKRHAFPDPVSVLGNMLVDFWVMVDAQRFIGSPMSSLSWNICTLRRLKGRSCDNLPNPDTGGPRCFVYPDVVG